MFFCFRKSDLSAWQAGFARALLFVCIWPAVALNAIAQEPLTTNRATEMRAQPDDGAASIQSLPSQAKVQLLERKGAWSRVKTDSQTGWVRMMHLRGGITLDEPATSSGSSGGFLSGANRFFGGNKQGNMRAQSATLGVRGLSPEELKAASPNPQALATAKSFASTKADAEQFAKAANLSSAKVNDPGMAGTGGAK